MTSPAVPPRVSIVIVSWNTRDLLERCLRAVDEQGPQPALEVIVVDNASTDGTDRLVREQWPSVTLIRNSENLGYAPACNQGLRAARGTYVLALNSDAFLDPGALAALAAELDAHGQAAAAGPRLLNGDRSLQASCARREPNLLSVMLEYSGLVGVLPGLRGQAMRVYPAAWYESTQEVEVLCGACVLYRRQALEAIGLLDERLTLNCDDIEWSMRARRMGYRLRYRPDATAVHVGGQSKLLDPAATTRGAIRGTFVFWRSAFGTVGGLVLGLAYALAIGVSLLRNLLLAPFDGSRRARARERIALLGECAREMFAR
jgi:GT2 family glycosyltransferase